MITAENILLVGSILIFTSILISKTGYRFGIPTLLLFLVVGMLFGSDGLGIQFNSATDAQFVGMIALSIILFSGGMDTKIKDIQPVMKQGILLSTVGVLLTTALTGGFIYYISGWSSTNIQLPLLTSMLLAATMSSTDSASVFSLLRSQRMNLKQNLRPMLELESGSNDPMAYMLTIVLIQVISSGSQLSLTLVAKDLCVQFLVGGVIGYAFGKFASWLINKIELPNSSLYPILLLSLVFITFTTTDLLKGNGYLAIYIAGVVVGNSRLAFRKEIGTFMNGMTWLFPNHHVPYIGTSGKSSRNGRHYWSGIAHCSIHDYCGTTNKCFCLSVTIPQYNQQSQIIYFMGRITRCCSYYFCNLSCHCKNRRISPTFQHCIFHYTTFTGDTRYEHIQNG